MNEEPSVDASRTGMRRRQETLWQTARRFGRLWGFLAFLLFVVFLFRGIVLPFIFGMLIAYLLAPTVARLQPKIGRALAVISCYLVILGALGAFFGILLPAVAKDFARLRETAPEALDKLNDEYLPRAQVWFDAEFGEFLAADGQRKDEISVPQANEMIVTPLGDGSYAVNLEHVQLSARQRDDGTWELGHTPDHAVVEDTDLAGELRKILASQGRRLGSWLGPAVSALVAGVMEFLTNFVITFMIAAFILVDLTRVTRFVRSLVPFEFRGGFDELWTSMDRGLGGVIRGQLLICLVNGVLTFVGMVLFSVKYSVLLSLLAGALSLIPIFGTIISSIPIIVIALVSGEAGLAFGPALGMLAWISGIHLLEANVLNPKIIGDSAHIHPVIVIFALLAGEHMFGLVGALLAIPATSLIQAFYMFMRSRSTVFAKDPDD